MEVDSLNFFMCPGHIYRLWPGI